VAGKLTQAVKRPGDFIARWGGEEFVVVLPNTDIQGAMEVATQTQQAIEAMDVPCADHTITKVTVSIGVNTWKPGQSETITDFVAKADRALYQAKNNGRNQVCLSDSTNSTITPPLMAGLK
jgi:diguanylate cyclase (GGDEF)-like protein